jgi:hypothetical protein
MHLRAEAREDVAELQRRQLCLAGEVVRVAAFDGAHGDPGFDPQPNRDRIDVAVRLGRGGPLAEARVAHELQRPPRPDARDRVPARRRRHAVGDTVGGHRNRGGQRELVEECRVGGGEMERDRAGGVVGDDPAREVAPSRMAHAARRADDAAVEPGGPRASADAGEPAAEVSRHDGLAVRIADASPHLEGVGQARVADPGQRERKIGADPVPVRSPGALERGEAIVRQAQDLPRERDV